MAARFVSSFVLAAVLSRSALIAQPLPVPSQSELARRLENRDTRAAAIRQIDGQRAVLMPVLLSVADEAVSSPGNEELRLGLIEAFAHLKAVEGVPFLIRNMRLAQWRDLNPWMKGAAAIRNQYPALNALIGIGAPACRALTEALDRPMVPDDQVAAIFVIAQVGSPGDATFLRAMRFQAMLVNMWSKDGLDRMSGARP